MNPCCPNKEVCLLAVQFVLHRIFIVTVWIESAAAPHLRLLSPVQAAEAAVDKVWKQCYADVAPFDRVP